MTTLNEWAAAWGVTAEALADLRRRMTEQTTDSGVVVPKDESDAQALVRLEASRKGLRLWRNNVGAGVLENGSFVRWGLANEAAAMNKKVKSSDLVGIRPRVIAPEDVGHVVGQFVAREVKRPGWRFTGTEREEAQLRYLEIVASLGGDAAFATGEGTL